MKTQRPIRLGREIIGVSQGLQDMAIRLGRYQWGEIERPHYVGGAGQPSFQNGWDNVSGEVPMRYYKDSDGIVHLEGVIAAFAPPGNLVFTLPAPYRPKVYTVILMTGALIGAGPTDWLALVNITPAGEVLIPAQRYQAVYINNITFWTK